MGIRTFLQELRSPEDQPLKPGISYFDRRDENGYARIHLRIDPDGAGTLLINANQIFHLNPTAAAMTYYSLSEKSDEEAVRGLCRVFRIPAETAAHDYAQFRPQLEALLSPQDACPICDLELEVNAPFSARPMAPYRMDLALTYRCNNDCAHCYNVSDREDPELTTEEWQQIIDQLWQAGVPHIIFTGGEPTLRSDLPQLIAHAQANGQITGVNTNGRRLSDPGYVQQLVDAGLDHIQITLESHDADIHDRMVGRKGAWKQTTAGIRNALKSRLYVMTNTTLLQENSGGISATLDFLAELGVPTVGLNALIYSGRGATVGTGLKEEQLPELLNLASHKTSLAGQKLIWYTPTQYCHFDPVLLQLGVKGCTAALYNMCIEPDGGVLPCQSYYRQVGNIRHDTWQSIWEHDLCVWLRERHYVPDKCHECSLLQECGGGCPLQLEQIPGQYIPVSDLTVPIPTP
ncbi:MAG: radical SAM/SPASM domain-containing protein [Anaerolineales bacterium]